MDYQVMPELTAEEYAELKADIAQRGVMVPIEYDELGNVLDGYHRLRICGELGIKDFPKVIRAGMTEAEKLTHARKLNMARRHLTREQRRGLIREELLKNWRNSDMQIAKTLGVSHSTVRDIREEMTLSNNSDNDGLSRSENSDDFRIGADGKRYSRRPVSVFNPTKREEKAMKKPEVVERMQESENMSVQQACNALKKSAVQERIEAYSAVQTGIIDIATTDRKYNIIYADPAWRYWEGGNKNQSLHYATMTIEDICALPVKNIAADDCALFLWVTYPILPDAFKVIEAWGFKYSTAAFVWVKKNKQQDTPFIGCGSWTRANSELCLLATKGNITRLDASISQIVESPIEEHSRKPAIVRELITRLVGEFPRIELFCRTPVEGWDAWGNEA